MGFLLALLAYAQAQTLPFADFNCVQSALRDGLVCTANSLNDKASGFKYSEPLVILLPDGVTRPARILLHFQGYRSVCGDDTTAQFIDKFGVLNLMKRARDLNAAVVLPRSAGKETTYSNELVPRFPLFIKWIYSQLGVSSADGLISGHSGAYIPIGAVLNQQSKLNLSVEAIVLLDATYSQRADYYAQWEQAAKTNPQMSVYSVIRPNTEPGTLMLAKTLKKYGITVQKQTDLSSHCGIPKKDFGPILDDLISERQNGSI